MNKIKVKINFENRSCSVSGVELTNGDYNSTKIEFEFDRTDGTKVFEMKKSNGELVFSDEIINNEIILVRYNEDNNPCSVFDEEGQYVFEVSLYSGDSKLTSDFGVIYVAKEQVQIGDEIAEAYLPIFDRMIQELEVAIDETNNLDLDAERTENTTKIVITKKDGTIKEVDTTGETGQPGFSPTANVVTTGANSIVTIIDENGTTQATIHTPVRGTDYWTNNDKEAVIQDVLNSEEIVQVETDVGTANTNADEAKSLARQCNKAKGYANYQTLVTELNSEANDTYLVGQSFLIQTMNVPDLWVYSIEQTSIPYTYVDDNTLASALQTNGYVQIGYYKISMLETIKQDLTNYVENTDYATNTTAGVVKIPSAISTGLGYTSTGVIYISPATEFQISEKTNSKQPIVPSTLNYAVRSVKPKVVYGLPETLEKNVIYSLGGNYQIMNLNLPYAETGDFIQVDFYSGATPTDLTITSLVGVSIGAYDLVLEANTIYSLFFTYGTIYYDYSSVYPFTLSGWNVSYAEYENAVQPMGV